jgi:NAD(P)-dependent dehydrogenase (short-subunit alcohol dehydrogenase family)
MNVWLITGASRGLGREIARQALDRGDAVVATARQPDQVAGTLPGYGDRLLAVPLDVTDPDQPAAAVSSSSSRAASARISSTAVHCIPPARSSRTAPPPPDRSGTRPPTATTPR